MRNNNCHCSNKPGKCNLTYLHRTQNALLYQNSATSTPKVAFIWYKVLIFKAQK